MIKVCDPNKIILGQKKSDNFRVFLDIDGVMDNWTESACKLCNIDYNDTEIRNKIKKTGRIEAVIEEEKVWEAIDKEGSSYWANLPLFSWSKKLYDELKSLVGNVCFLSSPSDDPNSAKGKFEWIKNNFDTEDFLIGSAKHFCANKNSLLVDDYQKKIDKFEEYGGNGFLWPDGFSLIDRDVDIEETKKELFEIIKRIK